MLGTTDSGRGGGERRGVAEQLDRQTEARWELQMVGGVEGSALASGVRYYADGAALETTDGRGLEMTAVAWPVRKAER